MRRKHTEPLKEIAGDLPALTAQQARFVELVLSGKRASEAYRLAYDCENSLPSTVWARASELMANRKVAGWLAQARMACLGSSAVSLEDHLTQLERLRELSAKSGNLGAAVQAEQLRGKASGHYVDRLDVTHHDPDELLRQMREIDPEYADKVASTLQ